MVKKVRKKKIELDFRGQKITVGIDVHLKQWNVSVFVGKRHFKTFQQEPNAETLLKYLESNFPGGIYESSYEAGYFGFNPHRELEKLGISNTVVNAADIPTSDKEKRRKNDRVDAKKIAKSRLNNLTEGIYVPTKKMEADRKLVRYRTKVVRKEVTRNKQRMKSFLTRMGLHTQIEGYTNKYWSKKIIEQIRVLKIEHKSDSYVLQELLKEYENLKEKLKRVNREIVELSRESRYVELVKNLKSIPGIGLLTAMVLITELCEMRRFNDLNKLSSYVGLIPDTSSSDSKQKVKGLTKRANTELRRLLIQSSWVGSSRCKYLSKVYHENKKKREQKAIIKVARKLLSIIRALWLKGEKYDIEKMYVV